MTSPRKLVMILCITLSVANTCAAPDVGEVSHTCGEQVDPLSDYQGLVEKVSRDLIDRTPTRAFNYYNEENNGEVTSYGHAICRNGISGDQCTSCLHALNVFRIKYCGFVFASQVTLKDCHMRIDEVDFKWGTAEPII
ncbi:hypothetical protein MLD38_029737 [Melastoma candidum]|uniref:Uncharacterized protein n=1 Tax=Melastoma candidum TaxID=119954 RepID=A0ACB9N4L5_9MYRT|nr:hypothetical protein MLD38_029737 [Melastoma candidum]